MSAGTTIQSAAAQLSLSDGDLVRAAPAADAGADEWRDFTADAAACVREHGIVILEDAIPAAAVAAMLDDFSSTYRDYMQPGQPLYRTFQDDPKRAQIPVAPAGALANPLLFANPAVMQLVHHFLGPNPIIGEMGGVISHPGSQPQYTHRDSAFLFGGLPVELELPPPSLTITVALMDVPLECGPTEYWLGSHRDIDPRALEAVRAVVPRRIPLRAGTVVFYDGRLIHRGGANHSDTIRPIVYVAYQHPWYLERPGYEFKPQLVVTEAMLGQMAPEHRRLFDWVLHLNRFDRLERFLLRCASRLRAHVIDPIRRRARMLSPRRRGDAEQNGRTSAPPR
jgi:ectoine hydroxylase-related dioxygenase (phytanoyl-CoA dioxygenase family)